MKKAIAVILVLMMTFALTSTALASESVSVTLGRPNWENSPGNKNQIGWASEGHDADKSSRDSGIPFEIFAAASGISFSVSKMPEGDGMGMQVILSSNDGGWWVQDDFDDIKAFYKENESGGGGRITFPFSRHSGALKGTEGKVIVAFWSENWDDIGIISGSLTGVPKALAEEAGVPTTGVVTFIGIAALALAASGTGAVIITRKLKK